ncbi:CMRF35-like molecule 8 isoform X4 [Brienomyrus brachyistius]|uniref:CMRF35-like molecule 8 isoform X4 n=1 Tax=Brienomyrus brachyistius TaxID=42636 RepID=UPI0020B3407D|nr:CMRF35-like molecule 8 isoform X4 [Brienomyrus brachyistius]
MSTKDDPDQRVFTVTISNLTAEDSDDYWCGVKISGDTDVGDEVYLSVTNDSPELSVDKQEVTGVEGDSVTVQCRYTYDYVTYKPSAPGSTPTGANDKEQSSLVQLALYVGLGSSVLLLVIIIITWKVWDKHKKKTARNQNPGSTEMRLNPDHEYSAVHRTGIRRPPPRQVSVEPGLHVTYSSIVLSGPEVSSRCSSHRPAVTPANDVVYSSVARKHRKVSLDNLL